MPTMASKRGPGSFIKADPDAKRVKREGGAGDISLASIPMAPTSAVSASSSAVVHKFDAKDRKVVDVVAVSVVPALSIGSVHLVSVQHGSPRWCVGVMLRHSTVYQWRQTSNGSEEKAVLCRFHKGSPGLRLGVGALHQEGHDSRLYRLPSVAFDLGIRRCRKGDNTETEEGKV